MHRTYILGGRRFALVEFTTLEHDISISGLLARLDLDRIGRECGDDHEAYSARVRQEVFDQKITLALLAHLIVPEELTTRAHPRGLHALLIRLGFVVAPPRRSGWSPEVARETEAFLGNLAEARDKARALDLVGELLPPFFAGGMRSWTSSLISGSRPTKTMDRDVTTPLPLASASGGE